MRHLLVPLVWLDTFVQKRFDSICFFLMRRFGIRKSVIRYTFLTTLILATAALLFFGFFWGMRGFSWIFANVVMTAMFAWEQRDSKQEDETAEARPGTLSRADRKTPPFVLGALKVMLLYILLHHLVLIETPSSEQRRLGWSLDQIKFYHLLDMIWGCAFLLKLYLVRTPLNPPPEKAREDVTTLTPAQS